MSQHCLCSGDAVEQEVSTVELQHEQAKKDKTAIVACSEVRDCASSSTAAGSKGSIEETCSSPTSANRTLKRMNTTPSPYKLSAIDNSPQKSFGDKVHPPPEGTRCFFDPTKNKPVMIVDGIAKEPDMVCDDNGFVSGIWYMAEGQWINWTSEVTMDTWAELETVTTPNPKKRKVMQRPAGSVCKKPASKTSWSVEEIIKLAIAADKTQKAQRMNRSYNYVYSRLYHFSKPKLNASGQSDKLKDCMKTIMATVKNVKTKTKAKKSKA